MKVLVFRHDNQLYSHFCEQFSARPEEIVAIPVGMDVIGTMVDLGALISQHQPSYFISTAQLAPDADKLSQKRFRANIEYIERVARKERIPFIFMSSAMVFDGKKLGYKEAESLTPKHAVAKVYAELEKLISRKSKRHIILRTSWLFSAKPENFLTQVIDFANVRETICINSAAKSCPTSMSDLARVITGMILQLELTDNAWGIYHYASSDAVLGFQFIEAVVAEASQFEDISPNNLPFVHDDCHQAEFYFEPVVLKCEKIRAVFGIHQKTWRQSLTAAVKIYCDSENLIEDE
ncbi:MAG: sugar nucleotide-binding protein [Sinobacterium sp.]|nr:sugar nucleotide-binding protein [Sinobacterium sp.]